MFNVLGTTHKVKYEDKGRISYEEAWNYQTSLLEAIKSVKKHNRDEKNIPLETISSLLFCEHNPVFTLGKSGSEDHLLLNQKELASQGFEYFKINRGGDITYHGPGQLTVYPIFDLDHFFHDVHRYVRCLEEVVIRILAEYDIVGERLDDFTGVWISHKKRHCKICAIGVHMSRWVSMHGLAFNVNTQIEHFDNIIPCGINEKEKEVTSLAKELGREIPLSDIKEMMLRHFREVFQFEYLIH